MLSLISIPSPLHPAVVHFPIVLLLLGTIVALVAVFTRRGNLPLAAAVLFVIGAIGTVVTSQTGERDGEMVKETAAVEQILEQHEDWADRTQVAAVIAALLAVGAVAITRWPLVLRSLSIATAAGALAASWCVIQTGHYGGQLVYRHGAGVNLAPAGSPGVPTGETTTQSNRKQKDHDD